MLRGPIVLMLLTEQRKTMADGLIDLGLVLRVFRQGFIVSCSAKIGMLADVVNFLTSERSSTHETSGPRGELQQFVNMIADIFTTIFVSKFSI